MPRAWKTRAAPRTLARVGQLASGGPQGSGDRQSVMTHFTLHSEGKPRRLSPGLTLGIHHGRNVMFSLAEFRVSEQS